MTSFTGFCPDCAYVFPTGQEIGSIDLQFNFGNEVQFSTDITYPENSTSWEINNVLMQALSNEFFDPEVQ